MPVTIKDIASYTGYSITTVSAVLNNNTITARINKETAEKVRNAASKLNYKPNMLASSLRKGFTNSIGIVISDLSNPFFIKLTSVIEHMFSEQGYRVFVVGSNEDDEKCKEMIDSFFNFRVDGLIIAATSGLKDKIVQLNSQKVPFVLLDRYFKGVTTNSVVLDNYQSAYNAVSYLLKKGRKRIATFQYGTSLQHMKDRFEGYKAALKAYGIRYDKRLTPHIPFTDRMNEEEIKTAIRYLVETTNIDAIFFQTTRTALPGLKAIADLKLNIMEDLSVICFHDNEFFTLLKPSITAQEQPIKKMAEECVRILLNNVKDEKNRIKKEQVFLEADCIRERESG